ncbi:MAG: hypothetical protein SFV15_00535 [Polyangiaceae bacterium]|nr:hypothetical protein [Polyangiaceae bacterium]
MRRFLLEPLLAENPTPSSNALLPFAARALGYRLIYGGSLLGGAPGWLLLSGGESRPLAVLARAGGVKGPVMEVPYAYRPELRDAALRLGAASFADAIVFNLSFDGAYRQDALRAAHAERARSHTEFIILREVEDPLAAGVSSWGPAAGLEQGILEALPKLGLELPIIPLGLPARDLIANTSPIGHQLSFITLDSARLERASLRDLRLATRSLSKLALPAFDGTVARVQAQLARKLSDRSPRAKTSELVDVVKQAVVERSAAGRQRLATMLTAKRAEAALVQTPSGARFVLLARGERGYVLVVAPTGVEAWASGVLQAESLAACAEHCASGGVCEASRP